MHRVRKTNNSVLLAETEEQRKKIAEIINPWGVAKDRIILGSRWVSFDKLAEVVDYLRESNF